MFNPKKILYAVTLAMVLLCAVEAQIPSGQLDSLRDTIVINNEKIADNKYRLEEHIQNQAHYEERIVKLEVDIKSVKDDLMEMKWLMRAASLYIVQELLRKLLSIKDKAREVVE